MHKAQINLFGVHLEAISNGSEIVSLLKAPKIQESSETDCPILKQCFSELREYEAGQRDEFTVPIKLQGTEFQMKVWQQMRKVPYGKTKSYSQLAESVKKPKAARAIGTACGKNPILVIVPCHRILGSNGHLGGFSAGLDMKKHLLSREEVQI